MTRATIQNLSDEILLLIFHYLVAKSLKNSSLVCYNWSDLIGSSTTTMEKFIFTLKNRGFPSSRDKLKRKHQSVEILYGNEQDSINEYFNKFLENFDDKFDISMAKNLVFISFRKIDASLVMRLLSQCPQLISLKMMILRDFNVNEEPAMKSVSLPKLKMLKIHWQLRQNFLLKFIKADQISELTLEKAGEEGFTQDDMVTTFVRSLTKLKKLRTCTYTLDKMVGSLPEFGLQLKTLHIAHALISTSTMEKLNKFLISQSSSLTELKFYSFVHFLLSDEIIRTISRLKCLSKLSVSEAALAPAFSHDPSHLRCLKPMTTLSELKMKNRVYFNNVGKYLIEKCPNLKRLKLECSDHRTQIWSCTLCSVTSSVQHISVHCRKLEVLSIGFVRGLIDNDKNFVHLKHLRVDAIANINDWIALINRSLSIESLVVKIVSEIQIFENIFADLLEKPTLSHLILRIKHLPEAGDIFRNRNYTNSQGKLKTLQLNFDNIHDFVMFELTMNCSKWCIEEKSIIKRQVLKNYRIKGEKKNI